MGRQVLKDKNCRVIGYIETQSNGMQVGKDAHNRILGYYDPKSDVTKDAHFRVISLSNTLEALITGSA